MRLPLIAAALPLLKLAAGVFIDEAWNVDYHYELFGEPKEHTTFFHQPNPTSKASLIYTLSKRGVLGAVNPRDGAVVWRHLLAQNTSDAPAGFLRAGNEQDLVISGSGNHVAAWSAADGRLSWNADVEGPLEDVEILEMDDGKATPGVKDALVLCSGDHPVVQRLDGSSGAAKWRHQIEGSDVPYQVSTSSTEVFIILLHKTMLGYIKIRVLSLDPVDGHKIDEYTLSSDSELSSPDTIVSVGANSASPIIAWTDAAYSTLKVNLIGTKSISSFNIEKHDEAPVDRVRIHAPYRANSLSHFLVHYEGAASHWADVFHINLKKGKIEKSYSLPKVSGRGTFSTSAVDANVYFTRVTSNELMTVSSVSHGILGRWKIDGLGIVSGANEVVSPVHAVSELSMKGNSVSAIRTAIYLSTGDWVLLRQGNPVWHRPEALASIASVAVSIASGVEDLAQALEQEAHSNPVSAYIHRLTRHVEELKYLPGYLSSVPQRFLRGFLGNSADGGLSRDSFGFHKIIGCATENGRLVALDAGNPDKILWNRKVEMDQGWHPQLVSGERGVFALGFGADKAQLLFNATTGDSPSTVAEGSNVRSGPQVQYTLRNGELEATRLDTTNEASVWHFMPTKGERIVSLVPRPVDDPVASIGKVLGDRRVLYKYLDPNLALLTTVNDAARSAQIYVLNTVSGTILYSNAHTGVDLRSPISSIVSENWFAYSYTAEASETSPKGHQLVVGELFESLVPNDRGPLSGAMNFSSMQSGAEPFPLVLSYQIPETLSKLAVTQTRQGITSRQLLGILADSQAIIGIPYGVIDPRRPVNRDPTKDELAEGLVRYTPVIELDPKWYLNHKREVLGIDQIITTPALLESTSIMFAYGLDIFGTRLSPSFSFDILGKDFNKFQMLATVAALAVATFVVAPLVSWSRLSLYDVTNALLGNA